MTGDLRQDGELLALAARGDSDAFAVLVRRHIRSATILATQMLGDQDDAEDIVQVAFTIVYERSSSFDIRRPFAPWFFAIVRKLAMNHRAREIRRATLLGIWQRLRGNSPVAQSHATASADAAIDVDIVTEEISRLPRMQRACFELVAVRGISIGEAAAMHGISESTVRQHVFRAKQALSRALGNENESASLRGAQRP